MEAVKNRRVWRCRGRWRCKRRLCSKCKQNQKENHVQGEEEEEGKSTQVLHITYLCEFICFFEEGGCLKTSVVKPKSRQDIQHVNTCP